MLNKPAAIELKNFVIHSDWYTIDRLCISYLNDRAVDYMKEYCAPGDKTNDVFSAETIAYSYALLLGLK
jgi:hypothetical protein